MKSSSTPSSVDIARPSATIRAFAPADMDAVLDIWLTASCKAHDFIDEAFWRSQVENMRNLYIPAAETCVTVQDAKVSGFYSLYENRLAALFVAPDLQGHGLGKQLLAHAKNRRQMLELGVYKSNTASVGFYLAHGFRVIDEQIDEQTGHPEYLMSTICS